MVCLAQRHKFYMKKKTFSQFYVVIKFIFNKLFEIKKTDFQYICILDSKTKKKLSACNKYLKLYEVLITFYT